MIEGRVQRLSLPTLTSLGPGFPSWCWCEWQVAFVSNLRLLEPVLSRGLFDGEGVRDF